MAAYLLKRLFLFIPALLLVSLLVFALSKATPGDPVRDSQGGSGIFENGFVLDQKAYQSKAKSMGLDKPPFYISVSSIAFPDTLHHILFQDYRNNLSRLIARYGNWPEIQQYYHGILQLNRILINTPDSMRNDDYIEVKRIGTQLYIQNKDEEIIRLHRLLTETSSNNKLTPDIVATINLVQSAYSNIKNAASPWRLYVPDIRWWGFDNQYHHWISNFLKGDFGISYFDGRPVSKKVSEALWWTLIMNLLALFFIFILSIPLGVFLARKKDSRSDRYISVSLFALYSLPVFWVATLLLVFFTTSEYGQWMNIFAGPGLGELRRTAPFWDRFWERGSHLILPVFCLTYSALAFVTRQIRGSMLDVMDQDFVRTARAKGLSENIVLWRHAFRNSLFPLISMMAIIIPGLLAGSIIVEFIFAIPGMGRLMFSSIIEQNWPIVYTVLFLTAILTMVSNLLADFCYAWADPRVTFGKGADRTGRQ